MKRSASSVIFAVYNLLFAAIFPFLLPGFLLRMLKRGGYRARMGDRFAIYPPEIISALSSGRLLEKGDCAGEKIWIHAVSVGEVQVAGQLMREWRRVEPTVSFVFTTTSSTGWKMAEREITSADVLMYNPLDFPNFVKSALRLIKPKALILTESEIWPCLIFSAARARIPIFLINARVSDRSAPRYAASRWFFGHIFSMFTHIFAQSELDKERLINAGATAERISVTGSFKFDVARRNEEKEKELREWIGKKKILLGGSTWPKEDEILLSIYKDILSDNTIKEKPTLVIAPRHFEKADAVEENIYRAGFTCARRSRHEKDKDVFLADTTGELMGLYGIADVVFVGKSLCEHGSQNMIEPCLCGKPTVVGPFTENFRPVMSDLLASKAICQISTREELSQTIIGWFKNGDEGLGLRAKAAVEKRCGVVNSCLNSISEVLKK